MFDLGTFFGLAKSFAGSKISNAVGSAVSSPASSLIGYGLLKGLNKLLNPQHNWFDYNSIENQYTRAGLTGAEREANAFSAEEAQKSRDFTQYMAQNKYQMETGSMEAAGLNPAMVYGGGNLVPTAANGATAASVAPQGEGMTRAFDMLTSLMRMPLEFQLLKSQAKAVDANTKRTAVETKGQEIKNEIAEETKEGVIEWTNLAKDERLAEINKKIAETTDATKRAELNAAKKITEALTQNQMSELLPLIKEGYELENKLKSVQSDYEEDRIRAELRVKYAEAYNLLQQGGLAEEQKHYAGKMTLGQVLGTLVGADAMKSKHPGAHALGQFYVNSPFGGLFQMLHEGFVGAATSGALQGVPLE